MTSAFELDTKRRTGSDSGETFRGDNLRKDQQNIVNKKKKYIYIKVPFLNKYNKWEIKKRNEKRSVFSTMGNRTGSKIKKTKKIFTFK